MVGEERKRRKANVVLWGTIVLFVSLLSICSCEESSQEKLPDTLTRPLSSISNSLAKESFWKRSQVKQTEYERGMQLRKGTDGHEVDLQEAVQLLEVAGEAGNDEALFALGEIYEVSRAPKVSREGRPILRLSSCTQDGRVGLQELYSRFPILQQVCELRKRSGAEKRGFHV